MEGAPRTEKPHVYSKEHCVQCNATYRAMDAEGIEYDVTMLEDEPEILEQFKADGYLQAPIVVANGERWSGFRPDKIKELGRIALQ